MTTGKPQALPPLVVRRLTDAISAGELLNSVLAEFVKAIESIVPRDMIASVLLLDSENRLRLGAAPSLPESYNQKIDGLKIGPLEGSCGTAAYCEHDIFVVDIALDPHWAQYKELALSHHLRACWSVPIIGEKKQVLGTMAMYYREPRSPSSDERHLIHECARLAGGLIEQAGKETRQLKMG